MSDEEFLALRNKQKLSKNKKIDTEEPDYWDVVKSGIKKGLAPLVGIHEAEDLSMDDYEKAAKEKRETQKDVEEESEEIDKKIKNDVIKKALKRSAEWVASASSAPMGGSPIKTALLAAEAGAVAQGLRESGVSDLPADIGAAFVSPAGAIKKGAHYATGLNPKNIDLKLVRAAEKAGIKNLPASVASKSKRQAFLSQLAGHTPFVGDTLHKKTEKVHEGVKNFLDKIKERVGPERTQSWESAKENLYNSAQESLPKGAKHTPKALIEKLNKRREGLKSSFYSPDTMDVLKDIEALKSNHAYGDIAVPTTIHEMINAKRNLNQRWPNNPDKSVKDIRKGLAHDVGEEIKTYGREQNPEWLKRYQKADTFYSKGAKREDFEDLLGNVGGKSEKEQLHYKTLFNRLMDRKNRKLMEKEIIKDKDILNDIDVLKDLSEGMSDASKRIPNPSGTAGTSHMINSLGAVAAVAYAPVKAAKVIAGGALLGLTQSKAFVNSAIKYANAMESTPNVNTAKSLAKQFWLNSKQKYGITPLLLDNLFKESRKENEME